MYYEGVAASAHRRLRSTKSEVNQAAVRVESGTRQSSLEGAGSQEGDLPPASSKSKKQNKLSSRGYAERHEVEQAEDGAAAKRSYSSPAMLAPPTLTGLV